MSVLVRESRFICGLLAVALALEFLKGLLG